MRLKVWDRDTSSTRQEFLDLASECFYLVKGGYLDPEVGDCGPFLKVATDLRAYDDKGRLVGEYVDGRYIGSHFDYEKGRTFWGELGQGNAWLEIPQEYYDELVQDMTLEGFKSIAKDFGLTMPDNLKSRTSIVKFLEESIGKDNLEEVMSKLFEEDDT